MMNLLAIQLPASAAEFLGWLLTGTNIVTFLGIIAALIKIGNNRKINTNVTNAQIGLLTTMADKVGDIKELAVNVQNVSGQVTESLKFFEDAIAMQTQANANLATFVMECFNRSNLSTEAKAELQVLADKIFYNDNTKVIESLKVAKVNADNAVAAGLEQIKILEAQLAEANRKLELAQENVKENRRV